MRQLTHRSPERTATAPGRRRRGGDGPCPPPPSEAICTVTSAVSARCGAGRMGCHRRQWDPVLPPAARRELERVGLRGDRQRVFQGSRRLEPCVAGAGVSGAGVTDGGQKGIKSTQHPMAAHGRPSMAQATDDSRTRPTRVRENSNMCSTRRHEVQLSRRSPEGPGRLVRHLLAARGPRRATGRNCRAPATPPAAVRAHRRSPVLADAAREHPGRADGAP